MLSTRSRYLEYVLIGTWSERRRYLEAGVGTRRISTGTYSRYQLDLEVPVVGTWQ